MNASLCRKYLSRWYLQDGRKGQYQRGQNWLAWYRNKFENVDALFRGFETRLGKHSWHRRREKTTTEKWKRSSESERIMQYRAYTSDLISENGSIPFSVSLSWWKDRYQTAKDCRPTTDRKITSFSFLPKLYSQPVTEPAHLHSEWDLSLAQYSDKVIDVNFVAKCFDERFWWLQQLTILNHVVTNVHLRTWRPYQ